MSSYPWIRQSSQRIVLYCVLCGNAFNGNSNRLYCSELCRELCRSERARERGPLYREKNLEKLRAKDREYCAKNRERRRQYNREYHRRRVEKNCTICNSVFTAYHSTKTCSQKCLSELLRRSTSKWRNYRRADLHVLEATRQTEALNWHLYGVSLYRDGRAFSGPKPRFTLEELQARIRDQRRKRRYEMQAAMKIYREMGFVASRRDRELIYQALKAEIPTI